MMFINKRPIKTKQDLSNYIILPETEDNPDLLVNLFPFLPRFYENIDYYQAQRLAKNSGSFLLNYSLFFKFIKLLISEKAFDGNGEKIKKDQLNIALEDILRPISGKAEWLDNFYLIRNGVLYTIYHKIASSGDLVEILEPLNVDTLQRYKRISLADLLKNSTKQGLPREAISEGSIRFWQPIEKRAAVFYADNLWANIFHWNPEYKDNCVFMRIAKTLTSKHQIVNST